MIKRMANSIQVTIRDIMVSGSQKIQVIKGMVLSKLINLIMIPIIFDIV